MRESCELAWLAALLHCKGEFPEIHSIQEVRFLQSVDIGNTMKIEARVGYVKGNLLNILTDCFVVDAASQMLTKTTTLQITY